MLFLGLIVFYLYYYDTCAYSISNSPLEIAFHSCTSYLLTLQPTRLAGYPRIQCSTIVVPWDIKLFNCTRNEAWNSSLTYFTWVFVFFFVYNYFSLWNLLGSFFHSSLQFRRFLKYFPSCLMTCDGRLLFISINNLYAHWLWCMSYDHHFYDCLAAIPLFSFGKTLTVK